MILAVTKTNASFTAWEAPVQPFCFIGAPSFNDFKRSDIMFYQSLQNRHKEILRRLSGEVANRLPAL